MTDLTALLKPDQGQPATPLHLVDKTIFDEWLNGQPERARQAVGAQGFKATATPSDSSKPGWPTLTVDETGQVTSH